MLRRVRVDGFVDPAVNPEIRLRIAVDIGGSDLHATGDRCLEDRCLDIAALPPDRGWLSDTDCDEVHRDGAVDRLMISARTTRWGCPKDPRIQPDDRRGLESDPNGTGRLWRGHRGLRRRCRQPRLQIDSSRPRMVGSHPEAVWTLTFQVR